jgi:predicted nucleic acid-binding protein
MIVFFDTSVHVALLRGHLGLDALRVQVPAGPIRLSPVVASELLRGARGAAGRAVERLVRALVPIEPPSWRSAFIEAGRLLPRVFDEYETIGLARLQNDLLLALTSRHTAATLVTYDRHFARLRRHLAFPCVVVS